MLLEQRIGRWPFITTTTPALDRRWEFHKTRRVALLPLSAFSTALLAPTPSLAIPAALRFGGRGLDGRGFSGPGRGLKWLEDIDIVSGLFERDDFTARYFVDCETSVRGLCASVVGNQVLER